MQISTITNKEKYFEAFDNLIKEIKNENDLSNLDIESFYSNISKIENLSLQDILTYMLYCFQVVELVQKWKLKKLINYDLFLNNIQNIYDEIFCDSNTTFNNKVIATISFGNIIEKTINYNIEDKIEPVLTEYLKCIRAKKVYLQNNDLILLRGNLYCQICSALKDNSTDNSIFFDFYKKLNKYFDYEKYKETANKVFSNMLKKDHLSYFELNNFLSFKAYNDFKINNDDFKIVLSQLLSNYRYEFFDKKIFIYLINNFFNNLIVEKDLKLELEFGFKPSIESDTAIFINYNDVDCNCNNNLGMIKNIILEVNKFLYDSNNKDGYLELQKLKDKLISDKKVENISILNYSNIIEFMSLNEYIRFLKKYSFTNFNSYFNEIKSSIEIEYQKIENKDNIKKSYMTNNELFDQYYSIEDRKLLVSKYPILLLEYDKNGNYKKISTVIADKTKLENKIKSLSEPKDLKMLNLLQSYKNLIIYRNSDLYSLLNDYYSLLLIDSIDSNVIKEKELVIKNYLPNLIKDNLAFNGKISKKELEEIFNDYIDSCVKKISQNRVNNKSFDSTKDFLNFEKSNADNYLGICQLQEILKQIYK